jgi:hypothetical protein
MMHHRSSAVFDRRARRPAGDQVVAGGGDVAFGGVVATSSTRGPATVARTRLLERARGAAEALDMTGWG